MHRTQIYFDEALYESIKQQANRLGISISAYIRNVLKKDIEKKQSNKNKPNFDEFAGLWEDRDITIKDLRDKAWK